MEALKSYLLIAMLASLASSLLIRISDPRHKSYLRYIAGLALLLLVVTPLTTLAQDFGNVLSDSLPPTATEEEENEPQAYIGEIGRTMSSQIGDLVAKQFELPRDAISVKLTLDLSDLSAIEIYRIDVTVSNANCDVDIIDRYLTDTLGCEVSVIGEIPTE